MIYLENTTEAQVAKIPNPGSMDYLLPVGIRLRSTTENRTVLEAYDVLPLSGSLAYLALRIVLPEGLPDGEYVLDVTQDVGVSMLVQIGEYERIPNPAKDESFEITQYERE